MCFVLLAILQRNKVYLRWQLAERTDTLIHTMPLFRCQFFYLLASCNVFWNVIMNELTNPIEIERISDMLGNWSKQKIWRLSVKFNYSSILVEFLIFWWTPFHYYVDDVWVEWNTKDSIKFANDSNQRNHLLFYLHGYWAV